VSVDWDGELTVDVPADPNGTATTAAVVTVTTPAGASSGTGVAGENEFTWTAPPPPSVTSVSPGSGPQAGGTSVSIGGTGFTGALSVEVGGNFASFTVNSGTSISATTPAASAPGTVDVIVNGPGGASAANTGDQFDYIPPVPVVDNVDPNTGPTTGGTPVTIHGANFTGAENVYFGSTQATIDSIFSNQINVTSPSTSITGTVNVTVQTAGGTSATSSSDDFIYVGPPVPSVSGVSPNSGGSGGGTQVQIDGSDFNGATTVTFGGTPASFSVVSPEEITAASPSGPACSTVDIRVSTPGGQSSTSSADQFNYNCPPPPPPHGYWLVGSDGGIFTFGSAQFYGSTGSLTLQRPVVGIVPTKDHGGYWLDASDGGVFAFGDTQFYGSIPGLGIHPAGSGLPNSLAAPIVGMVPSADDGGYFMVASDGGVFAFGDARFAGSCYSVGGCAGAAVAVMPDTSGNGYWVVTNVGSVYTFGDAGYFGAPGNTGSPVTSAVRTPDGGGYYILTANGTVYSYGDAARDGSASGMGGSNPASAIFATSDGGGYWVASANGAVDTFGDAPYDGSMAGQRLNGPIIAATGF
jgi:hypothetical protein